MKNIRLKTGFAFFGIYIVWGTTFLAIAYGLKGFPPFLLSALRFTIAGLLLWAYQTFRGVPKGALRDWKRNLPIGVLVLTGGTGILTWAEQYLSSTEACIMEAAGPFLFIALDKQNWHSYFSKKNIIIGLVAGFIGLLLFVSGSVPASAPGAGNSKLIGFTAVAVSLIFWVIGSLVASRKTTVCPITVNIAQQLLSAGFSSLLISICSRETTKFDIRAVPGDAWLGLAYLAIFGSIIAYFSYQYLITIKKPAIVSTHAYVNPVVALFAGWLLAGEHISTLQIIGLCIILGGVFLTSVDEYRFRLSGKKPKPTAPARVTRQRSVRAGQLALLKIDRRMQKI